MVPRVSGLCTGDRFEAQYFNAAVDGIGARPCPRARALDSELGLDHRGGEEAWEKLWPPHALSSPLRGRRGPGAICKTNPQSGRRLETHLETEKSVDTNGDIQVVNFFFKSGILFRDAGKSEH